MTLDREHKLKGKEQYSWPPCTNLFRSVPFDIANIIYFFTKQANNKEVSRTEHSPSVSVPCCRGTYKKFYTKGPLVLFR
jgi:hypothetical protein